MGHRQDVVGSICVHWGYEGVTFYCQAFPQLSTALVRSYVPCTAGFGGSSSPGAAGDQQFQGSKQGRWGAGAGVAPMTEVPQPGLRVPRVPRSITSVRR